MMPQPSSTITILRDEADARGLAWIKDKIRRGELFAVVEGDRQTLRAFHCAASNGEVRILFEKGTK